MTFASFPTVTGVVLAGGLSRRMNGHDKGLIDYQGTPLISYALKRLSPQVEHILINANRNIDRYAQFGYPVIEDDFDDFQGPLAGMLSALKIITTDYLLTIPCDCPQVSSQLRRRLMETLLATNSKIAYAHTGDRQQPVFCLMHRSLSTDLADFLGSGERKTLSWIEKHPHVAVDFSDQATCFVNFNRPEDLEQATYQTTVPLLGFVASSGTGKTTLLTKLIPELINNGIRVAVVKHAHHQFDIDKPGKDSYEIRQAGAQQVVVASSRLLALMQTFSTEHTEPSLEACLARIDSQTIDLILVEGFKHQAISKIELTRPSLGQPLFFPNDGNIIAVATDEPFKETVMIPVLDLNDIGKIVEFIQSFIKQPHRYE